MVETTIDHRITDSLDNIHTTFSKEIDPILEIQSEDIVHFECRDANNKAISADTPLSELYQPTDTGHHLTGPVKIAGATPGDVIKVDLLDMQHQGWGWTLFRAGELGLGLLPEDFPEPGLHIWELDEDVGHFVNGIEIPLDPFPGVVGLAPDSEQELSTAPPRRIGGNLDIKHLTVGSSLYLPVEVPGALLSIGDGHAAQGDGEVSISAIETPLDVTARISVIEDMQIATPQFETSGPFTPSGRDEPMYATTGIQDDLMEATKEAIREMIKYLQRDKNLTAGEAYILCSVAADLKINEVVDAPNWVVSAYIPQSIFPND